MVELRRCQLFLACVCFCPLSICIYFNWQKACFPTADWWRRWGNSTIWWEIWVFYVKSKDCITSWWDQKAGVLHPAYIPHVKRSLVLKSFLPFVSLSDKLLHTFFFSFSKTRRLTSPIIFSEPVHHTLFQLKCLEMTPHTRTTQH